MIRAAINIIQSFFNKGHERSVLTKKNIAGSLIIKGITMTISFVFVPLTLGYLNPTRNGIWLALMSIGTWFSLFDFGLGNGLRNKFAESKAFGNYEKAKSYVSSAYAFFTILMLIFIILFAIVNPYLNWYSILNVPLEYRNEINQLVWIFITSFCILMVLRLLGSVIMADQRPAKYSFIEMLGQLLSFIGVYILVKTTPPSLIKLAWIFCYIPVVVYLISSFWFYNKEYKTYRPSVKFVNLQQGKQMLTLGFKFFIPVVATMVVNQTTMFLIGHIVSPAETSAYYAGFKVFSLGYSVLAIVVFPYWSSFTDAYVKKDFAWMRSAMKKLKILFILFIVAQFIVLALSGFIYKIFIKEMVDVPFIMSFSIMIYVFSISWINIFIYPLNGIGKIKLQVYSSVFEMIAVIPLAFWAGHHWGTIGIILTPVVVCIPRMIWAPVQLNKLLNNKATGIWNK